ncbi:MAG: phospholipase D-like domain-containing protein [Phycisphaerae bacterium]
MNVQQQQPDTTYRQVASSRPIRVTVAGNELTVFTEAAATFAAMIADIHSARQNIWMETYIFANDASGQAVADALVARAREGLDVRLLYDAVGSKDTPPAFFKAMQAAGVKLHEFHSLWEGVRKFSPLRILNRRDHRKILIIDDAVAYFGGMNIVDHGRDFRFIGISEDAAPTVGWRDLHLRLTGPQQPEVSQSFLRSWNYAKGIPLPWRPTEYRRVRLKTTDESIHFFDSGPGLKFSRGPRVYRRLLLGAQRSVVIAMAYFIPVGRVMGELMAARHRGVRLTVLVPAKADVRLAQYATDSMYRKLLRARFHIYERTNRMMHTKLMIVDRQWSVVGSSNMDPRSLWTNLEFLAVIRSRPFAEAMSAIARYELRHSQRVNLADIARRGRLHRIVSALAWQLRWWL